MGHRGRPIVRSGLVLAMLTGVPLGAQSRPPLASPAATPAPEQGQQGQSAACNPRGAPGAVWWGRERYMTLKRFVSYAAPIVWFSPDEPSLQGAEGPAIRHPEPFTFEGPADHPVMYYQLTDLQVRGGEEGTAAFQRDESDIDASRIDLRAVVAGNLSFYAYYQTEEGLGAHPHDIEPVEFRLAVVRGPEIEKYVGDCPEDLYFIGITRSTGKAHGLVWFWNVLETDDNTSFPMHMLVEEGKHAFATDKNGDGVFTPGYDVNVRINDAWGVRDIIRTGIVGSGGYQSWMTKVRRPEFQVLPPLPDDSPLRAAMARKLRGQELAVYEIRPFPSSDHAGDDHALHHLMVNQEEPGWPDLGRINDAKQFGKFVSDGAAVKSLSISAYSDGNYGFSFVFPFFVVAHLNEPMTGGYVLQRMVLKDSHLRDFSWMLLYMPSASRWVDTYLSAGYEKDVSDVPATPDSTTTERGFAFETGVKFRVNVEHSPMKFMSVLTPYWGLRLGIKYRGFWEISRLTYVIEFGAGSF